MLNLTRPAAEYFQKQLGLSREETEVIRFGMQTLLYNLAGILTICLVGWLVGYLGATLAVALTAGSLRLLSGGAHSSSPLVCNLLGMVITPFLAIIAEFTVTRVPHANLLLPVLIGAILSVIIFYLLAPVDSLAKPITDKRSRLRFKSLSISLAVMISLGQIALFNWGNSPNIVLAMSFGIWWQAFTLSKTGHRFASLVDHLFLKGV